MHKKLTNLILLLLPALALFPSCREDDLAGGSPGERVCIRLSLPYSLGTRSTFGDDASTLDLLQWSVFEVTEKEGTKTYTNIDEDSDDVTVTGGAISKTLDLTLVKGKNYVVAACLTSKANTFATFNDGNITVVYANSKCNDDSEEMFAGCSTVFSSDDAADVEITLTRPFAQLNWGSSDLEDPTVERHLDGTTATVSVSSQLYTVRNLVTGVMSEPVVNTTLGTVDCGSLPEQAFPSAEPELTKNKLVAMNYILVADEEGTTVDCNLTFSGKLEESVNVNSANLCSNYRTNIYGDLLSFPELFYISVDKRWTTQDYTLGEAKEIYDAFKAGGNLFVPEGKVLDLTPFEYCNVKNGQTIEINGVLKLNSQQLQFSHSSNATYTVKGHGIVDMASSYYKPFDISYGKLYVSDITINYRYLNATNTAYTPFGLSSFSSLHLDNVKMNFQGAAFIMSYGNVYATNCTFESQSASTSPTFNMTGGILTLTNCNILSQKECVKMVNGTCNIDGGTYKTLSSITPTISLDGKNPKLTINGGDFYTAYDYSIKRITDELKKTIVSDKNKLDEYKPNKFTAAMVTQKMLEEYDRKYSNVILQGGRYQKGTFNSARNDTIGAAAGFKIIDWAEFPSGFMIVEDPSQSE